MASNRSGRVGRFGAWMGIVFAVTFIVGNIIIQPVPTHQKNTTEWQHLFNNSGKRTREVLGAYLVVFGLLAFLWFVSRLRSVLKDGSGAMLAFASVFAGLSFVATLVAATVAGGKIFVGTPIPSDGAIVQQLNNMSGALFSVPVPLMAGVFVAVASYLARRDSVLPGWLTMAGYVVAVLQLVGFLFVPLLLVPVWVLIVSIALMRREANTPVAA